MLYFLSELDSLWEITPLEISFFPFFNQQHVSSNKFTRGLICDLNESVAADDESLM